jgi:hypothetical protein
MKAALKTLPSDQSEAYNGVIARIESVTTCYCCESVQRTRGCTCWGTGTVNGGLGLGGCEHIYLVMTTETNKVAIEF